MTSDPDQRLFEGIYASLRGQDPTTVPWAHGSPHALLTGWLARQPAGSGGTALVIGSGLGDDAVALAQAGWRVTAFDFSPQAIAWARERFPDAPVAWHVVDLFELPETWRAAFDLVLEAHTIQALPVARRQATIRAIASTVAPGGRLLVITHTRDPQLPLRGRPWPLTEQEIRSIRRHGLRETERVVDRPATPDRPGRVRIELWREMDSP